MATQHPPVTMATQHPPVTMATEPLASPNMADLTDLQSSTATILSFLDDQLNSTVPECTAAGLKVIAEVWRLKSALQLNSDPLLRSDSWEVVTCDPMSSWFPLLRSDSREVRRAAVEVLQGVLEQSSTADFVPDLEMLLSLPADLADPREAGQLTAVLCVSPPLPRAFPQDYYQRLLQQILRPLLGILQSEQMTQPSRTVVSTVCCSLSALETFVAKGCFSSNQQMAEQVLTHLSGVLAAAAGTAEHTCKNTCEPPAAAMLKGNSRVIKATAQTLMCLVTQADVGSSPVLKEVMDSLVSILDRPEADCMVVSKCLQLTAALMKTSRAVAACSFSTRPGLTSVLQRRLCDPRWEIRDSVFEFLAAMMAGCKDGLAGSWLVQGGFHSSIWDCVEMGDGYAQASALAALKHCPTVPAMWQALLQDSGLTQDSVLDMLVQIVGADVETVVRTAAIGCFSFWVQTCDGIRHRILESYKQQQKQEQQQQRHQHQHQQQQNQQERHQHTFEPLDSHRVAEAIVGEATYDLVVTCSDRSPGVKQLPLAAEPTNQHASRVLQILQAVSKDLDWEVKLAALRFWEHVIAHYLPGFSAGAVSTGQSPNHSSRGQDGGSDVQSSCMEAGDTNWSHAVENLSSHGCLQLLVEAADDYDRPVSEKACRMLKELKAMMTSQDQSVNLEQQEDFLRYLRETDFEAILQMKTGGDSFESLLEDILSGARRREANQKDCYDD
ncbi:PREDICTED: BRCA1-associated ATM activator 1-like isoform X2 [Branchiostoma belcheri]|uniref:BRCA1-associated ATM activator 1-like isoform X2 n=1 Tax=Branchiostoma belcheri TaxID=7741 RepID=A0A6P4YDU0_BRABE|nr:PREDICTED: BRCA1-associated ATM activator 1-like isoform X2 [Branchiostoma belcheri]